MPLSWFSLSSLLSPTDISGGSRFEPWNGWVKSASATSMLCCPASIGIVSLIELGPDRKSEIWIFIFPPRMQQLVTSEAWDEWPRREKEAGIGPFKNKKNNDPYALVGDACVTHVQIKMIY